VHTNQGKTTPDKRGRDPRHNLKGTSRFKNQAGVFTPASFTYITRSVSVATTITIVIAFAISMTIAILRHKSPLSCSPRPSKRARQEEREEAKNMKEKGRVERVERFLKQRDRYLDFKEK